MTFACLTRSLCETGPIGPADRGCVRPGQSLTTTYRHNQLASRSSFDAARSLIHGFRDLGAQRAGGNRQTGGNDRQKQRVLGRSRTIFVAPETGKELTCLPHSSNSPINRFDNDVPTPDRTKYQLCINCRYPRP